MNKEKVVKIRFKDVRRRRRTRNSGPQLDVGVRVPCLFPHDQKYRISEILDIKLDADNRETFYVHFINYDKRLDTWVFEDSFDKQQIGTKMTDKDLEGTKTPDRKVTRAMKRKLDEMSPENEFHDPELARLEEKHKEATKLKNIEMIYFRNWEIPAWYYSPYPKNLIGNSKQLHICDKCLKYFVNMRLLRSHKRKCLYRNPPGDEIFRNGIYSFFEVDGATQKFYCQNLCLIAKLFLDHKTLYYDVDAFRFYVFAERDENGSHIIGYFSKEKRSGLGYNLACIMVLPPYQRKGWGKYLIHFSYQLSRLEKKKGTPEVPLSDLGRVSYHSYWRYVIISTLEKRLTLNINQISNLTSIKETDIITALQDLNMIKYWKKENVIHVSPKMVKDYLIGKRPIRDIPLEMIDYIPHQDMEISKKKKKKKKK